MRVHVRPAAINEAKLRVYNPLKMVAHVLTVQDSREGVLGSVCRMLIVISPHMDGSWHRRTPWFLRTLETDMESAAVLRNLLANTTIQHLARDVTVHLCIPVHLIPKEQHMASNCRHTNPLIPSS